MLRVSLAFAVDVLDIQDTMTASNKNAFNSRYIFLYLQNHLNRPRSVHEGMVSLLIQTHLFVTSSTIASMAKRSKLPVPLDCISTNIAARVYGLTALDER